MNKFHALLAGSASQNNSLVAVGLDSQRDKLPSHIDGSEPLFKFNKAIIDATSDLVCAFKINSAFYEAEGSDGIVQLKATCDYIHQHYPHLPIILDAKRADIGNTNYGYVKFAFEYLDANSITVHPYLGKEAIEPFLAQADRGIIILCRTSNDGSGELQDLTVNNQKIHELLAVKVRDEWNTNNNCLLVVGATYPAEMAKIRELVGSDMVFLVPGLGAQGGDIEKTVRAGMNQAGEGLILHSSRAIIFASSGHDFADAARAETIKLRNTINQARLLSS